MKKLFKLALVTLCLAQPGLQGVLHAGYVVDAQISDQPHGDGTYDYTITLNNRSSSTTSLGTFWFSWIPDYYGYDLLPSNATITQMPAGWSGSLSYGSGYGYYPDGYSLEFYNYYGSNILPGQSATFAFNSPDSPATMGEQSPYYPIPTMTSFVYSGYPESDPGASFVVTFVPEPSTVALMGMAMLGLWFVARPRRRQAWARRQA